MIAALVACAFVLACGSETPTSATPEQDPLPLSPGMQLLTLGGFALSSDPAFPPCVPLGQPRDGTFVSTTVMLSAGNGEWIARSQSGGDTLELRLHAAGAGTSGLAVAGTVTGSAVDRGLMGVTRDVRVTLRDTSGTAPASISGTMAGTGKSLFVTGRATGAMRFSDSHDESSTCSAIQWSMQPY